MSSCYFRFEKVLADVDYTGEGEPCRPAAVLLYNDGKRSYKVVATDDITAGRRDSPRSGFVVTVTEKVQDDEQRVAHQSMVPS